MSRYHPDWDISALLDAAARWRDHCLVGDGSLFSDGSLWTLANLTAARTVFVDNPQEGAETFFEKLHIQFGSSAPALKQLLAEISWLLMLMQSNIKPETKRDNIRLVWSWSGQTLPEDHPLLSDDVLSGVANTGTGYNTHRWRELIYLFDLAVAFKKLSADERRRSTADAWAFWDWLETVPRTGYRQFRHIIRYLCYPDTFERICVSSDKRRIIAAFDGMSLKEAKALPDRDRDERLLAIRRRMEAAQGTTNLDFYAELQAEWQDEERREWLFAWNPTRYEWKSLPADRLKTKAGGTVVQRWSCANGNISQGDTAWLIRVGEDPKGVVAVGNVTSEPYDGEHWDPARAVKGEKAQYVDIAFSEIRDPLVDAIVPQAELKGVADEQAWSPQSSGIEIKPRAAAQLRTLWEKLAAKPAKNVTEKKPPSEPTLEVIVIDAPKNVIFYGPPGTGKTRHLQQRLIPQYTDQSGKVTPEELIEQGIEDLSWWEVIGLALHDLRGSGRVADIVENRFFKAKARLQANNNQRATCWGQLQSHTSPDNPYVHVARRVEPFIFSKGEDSAWSLTREWQESCADVIALYERLGKGPAKSGAVARRYVFVTFHQSYSYEDFIEGIRPETTPDGTISYNVKPGVFRRICARAKADPAHRYAIFIDEINRGNVARIFGELITLVESDKRTVHDAEGNLVEGLEVQLPYSGDTFGVPRNLDIYGTMNTADRSTALLDTALRRRFQFHELMPVPAAIPGADGKGNIPDGEGGTIDLRRLLTVLNQRVEALLHRDQTLGHAFFTGVKDFEGLKAVLLERIIPQLQEYFYEDWSRIRLVLGDTGVPQEQQLVLESRLTGAKVFGVSAEDLPDMAQYRVKSARDVVPDAIRKIYELAE